MIKENNERTIKIIDPKSDLYKHIALLLKERGFTVKVTPRK